MRTSNSHSVLLICAILAIHVAISSSTKSPVDFLPMKSGGCSGSIAECLMSGGSDEDFETEFAMDSEISRRILATNRYISYGALRRNTVPCSRRGASYYNCRPGAQANPYSRGCNRITRCRN
ncbi:protein RALF-like 33 [Mercurialis annua]|uniref:protein RALF-like 33 n=1 Tax=Mercurialis annua TaxID=3986 RepID=UPI00215EA62E|nr:protein RALF-like 33 [Mercurialis annua]